MKTVRGFFVSIPLVFVFAVASFASASSAQIRAEKPPVPLRFLVVRSNKNDISPPLRDIRPLPAPAGPAREIPLFRRPPRLAPEARAETVDPVVQGEGGTASILSATIQNFEGVSNDDNVIAVGFDVVPPDTEGDVGPNHYVQWVNISLSIFDKTGKLLMGPVAGNTLFSGFGGPCETTNDGDPIVLYDHLADRWFLSQFALPNFPNGPFFQCIAVSQTGDPTGAYHRYEFQIPVNKLNDYPKFGVWPDAYYMSVNQFSPPLLFFDGVGVAAFERDKMLDGLPAQLIYGDLAPVNANFFGLLPSDLDGPPPPQGTPNFFASVDDNPDQLNVWEFHVDFANPPNSTFGVGGMPNQVLGTAPFDSGFGFSCDFFRQCVSQPSPGELVDVISDRLMFRLQYRNLGTYASLMANHTVDAGGNRAGVRWYELRNTGGGWGIQQQGTYAPADGDHRWMGGIAMDRDGNIALGYSVSSTTTFPSVRYAGRGPTDPPGTLSQAEAILIPGTGVQTAGGNRWGDYSMMAVDPTDDCTFWYTQEYYATTSAEGWQTRIGSFRFPSCGPPTDGGLTLSQPIPGQAGVVNSIDVSGATPGATVFLVTGFQGGSVEVPSCPPGISVGMGDPAVRGSTVADVSGNASFSLFVPGSASGRTAIAQGVELSSCTVGTLVIQTFP